MKGIKIQILIEFKHLEGNKIRKKKKNLEVFVLYIISCFIEYFKTE